MLVKQITKYVFQNVEYSSIKDLQDKLHDTIGIEVLDLINKQCDIRHKDLLKLLDIICSPEVRKVLKQCLNVEIELDDEEVKNVLDFNFAAKNN